MQATRQACSTGAALLLAVGLGFGLKTGCLAQGGGADLNAVGQLNREYHVTRWNSEDGLPQNFVRAILQSRDGYLWLGTQFGLVRFDGRRFTVFTRYSHREMVNDTIHCLDEDTSGALWIGTGDGLLTYYRGKFTHWDKPLGPPPRTVRSVRALGDGSVWASIDGRLLQFKQGTTALAVAVGPETGHRLTFLDRPNARDIEVKGTGGVFRLDRDLSQLVRMEPTRTPTNPGTWLLSTVFPGHAYFGDAHGLYSFKNGSWSDSLASVALPAGDAPTMLEDRDGGIWVGSRTCPITRLHKGRIAQLQWGDGTESVEVFCFFEDREGNIWVGTDSGLVRLTPKIFRTYTTRDGLDDNKVQSVSEARNGGVWATTERGLNRIKDDTVQPYVPDVGLGKGSPTWAVLEDDTGLVWMGRARTRRERRSTLLRFRDGNFSEFELGFSTTRGCHALYLDSLKRVWFATGDGVFCWSNGIVAVEYRSADDSFYNDVRAIQIMRDGSLWLASAEQGVRRIHEGTTNTYCRQNQMASDAAWSFYEDPEGVVWVGGEYGLHRCEKGRVFAFTRDHGLHEDVVNHIIEDDSGNLWLSGLRGIYRVKRQHLNDVAAGRTNLCRVVAFGESEGMESAETNGESQPAGCKTRDGRIWFPTGKGLVMIDPKTIPDNELLPPVVIEQVVADEELILREGIVTGSAEPLPPREDGEPRLRLRPGRARVLELFYTANLLTAPERVRFKYRLDGYDTDWRDADDRRLAIYTSLGPGSYRFRVIACNTHGYWTPTGAGFGFVLKPHFYETWPFYLLCGLAVVAVTAFIVVVRLRVQRKFFRLQQQAELERVRARIAEDMHDDVGASLSQIAILSEVARRELNEPRHAEQSVQRISGIARQLVDSLSELVWATNPRNDTLDNMAAYFRAYAANYFEPTTIRCRLEFPAEQPVQSVPPEIRRALFLVLKEALHNIVKHSGASEAAVTFRFLSNTGARSGSSHAVTGVELVVSDNGRGMADATGRTFGNGLRNMRRRVESIEGAIDFQTALRQGTCVTIQAPLRPRVG